MDVKNPLGSLLPGSKIFLDANIFLYSIFGHPTLKPQCKEFLLKVENGVYESVTSTLVLNEVMHKLILAEVAMIKRLSYERDALRLIKEQPEIISSLSMTWRDYTDIKKYPITILSINEKIMDTAVEISKKHGLLISDSVHVAAMNSNGIINIASNDGDFERVEGINVWSPRYINLH